MARPFGVGALGGTLAGLCFRELGLTAILPWPMDRVYAVPFLIVVGALLGLNRRLRSLIWIGAALLGALWLAVAFTPLTAALAGRLVRRDAPAPADAIVVLGSALQRDGDLTTTALNRLLGGLTQLHAGLAPRLVLTEWTNPPTHVASARRLLAELGLTADIVAVGRVRTTRDEAVLVAARFRAEGWTRAIVVTSPAHSRRTAEAFEREGLTVISLPCVDTAFDSDRYGGPNERLNAFGQVAHETVGLIVYRWRGWLR